MKLTIVRDDAVVGKDGECISGLDVSYVPSNVHALQWNGVKGWIEFAVDADFFKPENEIIGNLPDWAHTAAQKWADAKAAQEAQTIENTTSVDNVP